MHTYRIHYLADMDDGDDNKYSSQTELKVGELIQLGSGFFHVVCKITQQKTGIRIDVSKSSQSKEDAFLLAE